MRTVIIGFTITILLFVGGLCLLTIDNKNVREQELRESLNMAIEDSLSDCMINKSYSISNKSEFMADFCNKLMLQVNQNCELKVKLVGSDLDKGIIYIQVISDFGQVNGEDGTITCTKAVALEKKSS